MAKDNEKWITVHGKHIKVESGESIKDAIARSLGKVNASKTVDKLRDSNPNGYKPRAVVIDLSSDIQKQFDNATKHERQKIAKQYILDNFRGRHNTNNGDIVNVTVKSAKKISYKADEIKIRASAQFADLIMQSEFVNFGKLTKNRKDYVQFAYYKTRVNIGNKNYVGILNVGIDKDNNATLSPASAEAQAYKTEE